MIRLVAFTFFFKLVFEELVRNITVSTANNDCKNCSFTTCLQVTDVSYCTPASAEVVSSILTKVGFVFFRNGKRGNVSK